MDFGKKERCREMDYISKLPLGIVESILCLVSIQEAARTSILSKEWRYHWTKIPKLVFDEKTFQASVGGDELEFSKNSESKGLSKRCKMVYAIFQVLLSHNGTIHEFSLSMKADKLCIEIGKIVRHLSLKNTVKKLTIDLSGVYILVDDFLSLYIFSMTQLTDLYLSNCLIGDRSLSSGPGRLTSLYVCNLYISAEKLLEFLSKSPLLKNVTLNLSDTVANDDYSTVVEFFECLPVVEDLSIWCELLLSSYVCPDINLKELTTALVHLKYLRMEQLCFIIEEKIDLLFLVIRSSPNLEKLKLEIMHYEETRGSFGSFLLKDYSDIWLEHLNEFEIINLTNRKEAELDFVKLIFAKSPVLKKVTIFLYDGADEYKELKVLRSLLLSPHASPVLDIMVRRYDKVEE